MYACNRLIYNQVILKYFTRNQNHQNVRFQISGTHAEIEGEQLQQHQPINESKKNII